MKHLSLKLLSETVISRRKTMGLSQAALSKKANINRSILSRLETCDYSPSVDQLLSLSAALGFQPSDVIVDDEAEVPEVGRKKIAVAGTGYVGLSLAVLLSQHNDVTAVDIVPAKVEKINNWKSPIQDEYIEKYMAEHEERGLNLTATTDAAPAYASADFIIIAAPTNYDPKTNFFDCSAVETVLGLIKEATADRETKPTIVIKSTIPVGYTVHVREKMQHIDLNNKTILVTGSPGFIGANLVIRLLKELNGGTVVSLDNMNDYYDPALKEYRLGLVEKAAEQSAVKHIFVRGSIGDKELVDRLFASYHFDIVVNLAAQAGVRYSIDHPDVYICDGMHLMRARPSRSP